VRMASTMPARAPEAVSVTAFYSLSQKDIGAPGHIVLKLVKA
jgi:hypothetical protein